MRSFTFYPDFCLKGNKWSEEYLLQICLRFASTSSADGMLRECKGNKWSEKSGQEISKRSFLNANYRKLSVNYREIIVFFNLRSICGHLRSILTFCFKGNKWSEEYLLLICLRFASKSSADGMLRECKGNKWPEKFGREILASGLTLFPFTKRCSMEEKTGLTLPPVPGVRWEIPWWHSRAY